MDAYIPLISGLVGALIGAAASIVTVIVQTRAQSSRDRTKEAIALAVQDWKFRCELMNEKGGKILPLAVYVHYHSHLIRLAEDGNLNPQTIKALSAEQDGLIEAIDEINEGWRNKAKGKQIEGA
jgi:hypothetical protein